MIEVVDSITGLTRCRLPRKQKKKLNRSTFMTEHIDIIKDYFIKAGYVPLSDDPEKVIMFTVKQ